MRAWVLLVIVCYVWDMCPQSQTSCQMESGCALCRLRSEPCTLTPRRGPRCGLGQVECIPRSRRAIFPFRIPLPSMDSPRGLICGPIYKPPHKKYPPEDSWIFWIEIAMVNHKWLFINRICIKLEVVMARGDHPKSLIPFIAPQILSPSISFEFKFWIHPNLKPGGILNLVLFSCHLNLHCVTQSKFFPED